GRVSEGRRGLGGRRWYWFANAWTHAFFTLQLISFAATTPEPGMSAAGIRPRLANSFYYLDNFRQVLSWVDAHHRDLLTHDEVRFLDGFPRLPQASQALLVRMAMRKGDYFRSTRLKYEEIGDVSAAVEPLLDLEWVDAGPILNVEHLASLVTRPELFQICQGQRQGLQQDADLQVGAGWAKGRLLQALA